MKKFVYIFVGILGLFVSLYVYSQTMLTTAHWTEIGRLAAPIEYKLVDDAGGGTRAFYFRMDRTGWCLQVPGADLYDFLDNTVRDQWMDFWPHVQSRYTGADNLPSDYQVQCGDAEPPLPTPTVVMTDVFTLLSQESGFFLVQVGSVPMGTECDPAQNVLDHYKVSKDAVTWLGNVEPEVVVARCAMDLNVSGSVL